MADFSQVNPFNKEANFTSIKFGVNKPLLETELNELQSIVRNTSKESLKAIYGDVVFNKGTYSYVNGSLTIANELMLVNGELITIDSVSLATTGDVYLQTWEQEVTGASTLKKYGNIQSSTAVTNKIYDSRIGAETSRRTQLQYALATTTDISKYCVKLGYVSNGKFVLTCKSLNVNDFTQSMEGSYITAENTTIGSITDIEVLGNTIQDTNNLADIKSVGILREDGNYEIELKSCGKNLINNQKTVVAYLNEKGEPVNGGQSCLTDFIKVKPSNYYKANQIIEKIACYDINKNFIMFIAPTNSLPTTPIPSNVAYIRLQHANSESMRLSIQLEEGTVATTYEPHQGTTSKVILPCQLEKVGNISDRLFRREDGVWCVEKNICDVILDGSESWSIDTKGVLYVSSTNWKGSSHKTSTTCISNKYGQGSSVNDITDKIFMGNTYLFMIKPTGFVTTTDWINNLKVNPLTVKYATTTPQIIELPLEQQISLNSFFGTTNIFIESGEVDGTIKCTIPKSLGSSVSSLSAKADSLETRVENIETLQKSNEMEVSTKEGYVLCEDTNNGYITDVKLEGNTLVNLSKTKESTLLTPKFNDIQGNFGSLNNEGSGYARIDKIVGNTLVNLVKMEGIYNATVSKVKNPTITLNQSLQPNKIYTRLYHVNTLKTGDVIEFPVMYDMVKGETNKQYSAHLRSTGWHVSVFTNLYEGTEYAIIVDGNWVKNNTNDCELEIDKFIILEGDYTNKPIPSDFIEGLKSTFEDKIVTEENENKGKYAVDIKVVGKNKFDISRWSNININTGSEGSVSLQNGKLTITGIGKDTYTFTGATGNSTLLNSEKPLLMDVEPNKVYTLSFKSEYDNALRGSNYVALYSKELKLQKILPINNNTVKTINSMSITTTNNTYYIGMRFGISTGYTGTITYYDIQIEEGTVATEREEYFERKETIYLNSPLLEGDELVVKNDGIYHYHSMGKIIIDDISPINCLDYYIQKENTSIFRVTNKSIRKNGLLICNSLQYRNDLWGSDVVGAYTVENSVDFRLLKNQLGIIDSDTDGDKVRKCKQYLNQNPLVVIYELAQPYYEKISDSKLLLEIANKSSISVDSIIPCETISFAPFKEELPYLEPNTKYKLTFQANTSGEATVNLGGKEVVQNLVKGINEVFITTPNVPTNFITIGSKGIKISELIVAKEGYNGYFDGLLSTGQDVEVTELLSRKELGNLLCLDNLQNLQIYLDKPLETYDSIRVATDYIYLPKGDYIFDNVSNYAFNVFIYDTLGHLKKRVLSINGENSIKFTISDNEKYIRWNGRKNDSSTFTIEEFKNANVTLTKGSEPISDYIPCEKYTKQLLYKNLEGDYIPVPALRKINDEVKDTIELHSDGKYYYHKRCNEVVFNGSENWEHNKNRGNTSLLLLPHVNIKNNSLCISNRFKCDTPTNVVFNDIEAIATTTSSVSRFSLGILNSRLLTQDLAGFKSWLQENPLTVVYQLATEEVYECNNLDLVSYEEETLVQIESGVINPSNLSFKVSNSLGNVITKMKEEVEKNTKFREELTESITVTKEFDNGFEVFEDTKEGVVSLDKIEGNTLINLVQTNAFTFSTKYPNILLKKDMIKPNTLYTFILTGDTTNLNSVYCGSSDDTEILLPRTYNKLQGTFTSPSTSITKDIRFICYNNGTDFTSKQVNTWRLLILEGDYTNILPPYFEGLKSVGDLEDKIEVLSNNANLISDLITGYAVSGSVGSKLSILINSTYSYVKANAIKGDMYYKSKGTQYFVYYTDENLNVLKVQQTNLTNLKNDVGAKYIFTNISNSLTEQDVLISTNNNISINTVSPKSNSKEIYYINSSGVYEKPILRGLPNGVKDTIEKHSDGKYYYHKRCEETTLNGSESTWFLDTGATSHEDTLFFVTKNISLNPYANYCISDKFLYSTCYSENVDKEGIYVSPYGYRIRILKSKLSTQDVTGFKSWLQSNPVTLIYQLATEEVYECVNLGLDSYEGETSIIINSTIPAKIKASIGSNLLATIGSLKDRINYLETEFSDMTENGSGWCKLPNGMIMQWGKVDPTTDTLDFTGYFPVTFKTKCDGFFVSVEGRDNNWSATAYGHPLSAERFRILVLNNKSAYSNRIRWFAIGY